MRKLFHQIRLLGVRSTDNRSVSKRTILLNEIIFVLLIIQFFLYPEFLINFDLEPLIIVFVTQLFTVTPLVLSYYYKANLAKWYFNIIFPIVMTIVIITHGQALRADFCYFVFGITAILFFEKTWHRIFLFSIIVGCFLFSDYYTNHYPAIFADNVSSWNSTLVFIAMLACIAIVIDRFVSENNSYETEQNNYLETLERQQTQIQRQNQDLVNANQDLERFASMASHDLKSPLRNIGSFIGLIRRKIKKYEDNDLNEYLEFVEVSVQQMSHLIQDILEYSKIGNDEIHAEEVYLENVLSTVKSQLQHYIKERNATIESTSLPIIRANATQMQLLFQNIIENGIKYNESDAPLISIYYFNDDQYHHFSFQDNGIGIAPEFKERVFGMFKRLHNTTEYKGTGIGLAICKKIVEHHGGEVELESVVGSGSIFSIKLPI